MTEKIVHYYRKIGTSHSLLPSCKEQLASLGLGKDADKIIDVERESCFNVQLLGDDLEHVQKERLEWLLAETFQKDHLKLEKSFFDAPVEQQSSRIWQVEFGPRMTFTSAFSSNACSICRACAIPVDRLELSKRYRFHLSDDISEEAIKELKSMLHDKMTEEEYLKPLTTFDNGAQPVAVTTVPIMEKGRAALEKINEEKGLGFDDFDLDYYTKLFKVSTVCLAGIFADFFCIFYVAFLECIEYLIEMCIYSFSITRKNLDETLLMSSASIWASQTRNTLGIGFLVGR